MLFYSSTSLRLWKEAHYVEVPKLLYHAHSIFWRFYFACFYHDWWFVFTVCSSFCFAGRNVHTLKMSDSEIIPLSIFGELIGLDSENTWYSFVKRNFHHLFPVLCCRTRFNRTRRSLLQVTELFRQNLTQSFPIPASRYFVFDSFPLPVCKFGRVRYCLFFRADGANYGRC